MRREAVSGLRGTVNLHAGRLPVRPVPPSPALRATMFPRLSSRLSNGRLVVFFTRLLFLQVVVLLPIILFVVERLPTLIGTCRQVYQFLRSAPLSPA